MITIIKEPNIYYPAFEDSFVEFESDLIDNDRAEVVVIGSNQKFAAFKNREGKYIFNLVEFAKSLFNDETFEDTENINSVWGIRDIIKSLSVQITVFNDTNSESKIRNYGFFKGIYKNDGAEYPRLLIPKNETSYDLTYFEGYPYFFETSTISKDADVSLLNTLSNVKKGEYKITKATKSARFNLDKATNFNSILNENSKYSFLIYTIKNGEFFGNEYLRYLKIKKVEPKCGVYLKWFNSHGGYSFFLFDNYFDYEVKTKEKDYFGTNNFKNVNEKKGFEFKNIGKEFETRIKASVKADKSESNYLEDLFYSPHVQMYSETEPNKQGEFLDIEIKGDLKINNKKNENEIKVTIIKPDQKTITY